MADSDMQQQQQQQQQQHVDSGTFGRVTETAGDVWQYMKRNKIPIMTWSSLLTFGYVMGAITMYYTVGPQHQKYIIRVTTDKVVERLRDTGTNITNTINVTNVTNLTRVTNVTNKINVEVLEYKCLLDSEQLWRMDEAKLASAAKQLEKSFNETQRAQMNSFNTSFTAKLEDANSTSYQNLTSNIKQMHKNVTDEVTAVEGRFNSATDQLQTNQNNLHERLGQQPILLEHIGFTKIDYIGPAVLALAGVEILLAFCMCLLFSRVAKGPPQSGVPSPRNGNAVQPLQEDNPPPRRIDTNNNNVTFLYFHRSDEDTSRYLGSQLIEPLGRRVQKRTLMVNSLDDIDHIPACHAALVFVDPDEREMIIEDPRHHIGQGLRRQAVQRLLDSEVEVFIIIFNDRNHPTLGPDQLYNRKLGQINEHAQLRMLKERDRVLSIRDKFTDFQKTHMEQELRKIFF